MKKANIDPNFLRIEYLDNGKSAREIARILGVNTSTILRHIEKLNIPKHSKRIDKNILEKLYIEEELSCSQIGAKFNCCANQVLKLLTEYKIPRRQYRNLYTHNQDFFSEPNSKNCYWAGFLAADGCVAKQCGTHKPYLTIAIKDTDEDILYKFKEACQYTGPITHRTINGYGKYNHNTYNSSWLTIRSCDKMISDLETNFNITSAKSLTLQPPNLINIDLQLQYIIGLIDGDGCISLNNNNVLTFELVGTKEITEWASIVLNTLEPEYEKMTVYSRKNQKCCYINCTWNRAYKLLTKLYEVPTPYKLARKWDKLKEFNQ